MSISWTNKKRKIRLNMILFIPNFWTSFEEKEKGTCPTFGQREREEIIFNNQPLVIKKKR